MKKQLIIAVVAAFALAQMPALATPDLMDKFEQAQKKQAAMKRRYDEAANSRDISVLRQFVRDYPKSKFTPEIQKRINEIELWEMACRTNTVQAYNSYKSTSQFKWYSADADSRINGLVRAQEKKKWDAVAAKNSIAAYEQYLAENPGTAYRKDALQAIDAIKAAQAWKLISNSQDIAELRDFVSTYPTSAYADKARTNIVALEAMQLVRNNELSKAYSKFASIVVKGIPSFAQNDYIKTVEYHDFSALNDNSSSASLENFLKKYPYSQYKSKISNYQAINAARNFGSYASDYDYNRALSLASDTYTRNRVQYYIDSNKAMQKERRRQYKAYERRENGGWLNMGFEFLDFAADVNNIEDNFYYAGGFHIRFGNFNDRVNFSLGVKCGYNQASESVFMPLQAQLKVKICPTGPSRLFLFGGFDYMAIRDDYCMSDMAWRAGIVFSWKHLDWSFYYRKEFGEGSSCFSDYDGPASNNYFGSFVGTSMTYYFSLHRN